MGHRSATRYQAAIICAGEILLIKHREHASGRAYWLLPGGGREDGETEIECVQREVQEETNLNVEVQALLLDELRQHTGYKTPKRYKTYLCQPSTTEATPGYEPEPDVAAIYAIVEVGWFSITDESTWNELILQDAITTSELRRISKAFSENSRIV